MGVRDILGLCEFLGRYNQVFYKVSRLLKYRHYLGGTIHDKDAKYKFR